jgi:hypothetical protein
MKRSNPARTSPNTSFKLGIGVTRMKSSPPMSPTKPAYPHVPVTTWHRVLAGMRITPSPSQCDTQCVEFLAMTQVRGTRRECRALIQPPLHICFNLGRAWQSRRRMDGQQGHGRTDAAGSGRSRFANTTTPGLTTLTGIRVTVSVVVTGAEAPRQPTAILWLATVYSSGFASSINMIGIPSRIA